MFHPNVRPKKFQFYVVVDPATKLLVPFPTNKTVDDLINAVKSRLHKKNSLRSQNNNNHNNNMNDKTQNKEEEERMNLSSNIDALTTMYWVDAQTLKPKHIYVILRGTDKLQKLLNAYKSMVSNDTELGQFYWFIARSPSTVLNIAPLRPTAIRMAPEEIRQKYHRNTPYLYPGFYFNFFIAKKYHGPNHQEKRKQIELYRQQRLQSKYHINSPVPIHSINDNNNNNNNNNNANPSNNRGRYFTANAMNEIRHHQQIQNQQQQQQQQQQQNISSDPDNNHNHNHNDNNNQFFDNNNNNNMNNNVINNNNNDNNNNNNNNNDDDDENQLHFHPKQSLINRPDDSLTNLINTSNNKSNIAFNNNNNNISWFEDHIPSYLKNNNYDTRWKYLYNSFDFKYILLLCFVCRCLNNGELPQSHHVKLSESAKLHQLTDEEFEICVSISTNLGCDHVKETVKILSNQNDAYYINFERMIIYDSLVHLTANGFQQKRLQIIRICSQFGTVNGLSPVEIACIIQMFETEYQLLNVYRHLF